MVAMMTPVKMRTAPSFIPDVSSMGAMSKGSVVVLTPRASNQSTPTLPTGVCLSHVCVDVSVCV